MMNERIDQRSRTRTRGGMDHHPRRFVDDDQIIILISDSQRDCLGLGIHRLGQRQADHIILPFSHPGLTIKRHAGWSADRAIGNQPRQPGPGQCGFLWRRQCKRLIKPVGRIGGNGDDKVRHG